MQHTNLNNLSFKKNKNILNIGMDYNLVLKTIHNDTSKKRGIRESIFLTDETLINTERMSENHHLAIMNVIT